MSQAPAWVVSGPNQESVTCWFDLPVFGYSGARREQSLTVTCLARIPKMKISANAF